MDGSLPGRRTHEHTVEQHGRRGDRSRLRHRRATALHLARDGFDVAMMDLDPVGLAATHDQIKACGGQARSFAVDLCDPLEVGSVTREIAVTSALLRCW